MALSIAALQGGFWALEAGEPLFEPQELNMEAKTDRLIGLGGGQSSLAKTPGWGQ